MSIIIIIHLSFSFSRNNSIAASKSRQMIMMSPHLLSNRDIIGQKIQQQQQQQPKLVNYQIEFPWKGLSSFEQTGKIRIKFKFKWHSHKQKKTIPDLQ